MTTRELKGKQDMFTTRDLVLISLFSALFLAYGYISGISLPQQVTHSLDLFFLISVLFTILALEIRQFWSATVFGLITGVIFLGTPGAPAPWHITLALVANGLVFDLCLGFISRKTIPPSSKHMVIAAALGNLVMAVVGLSALQPTVSIPAFIWPVLLLATTLLGAAGALFGITLVRRIRAPTRNIRGNASGEAINLQQGEVAIVLISR